MDEIDYEELSKMIAEDIQIEYEEMMEECYDKFQAN